MEMRFSWQASSVTRAFQIHANTDFSIASMCDLTRAGLASSAQVMCPELGTYLFAIPMQPQQRQQPLQTQTPQ